MVTGLAQSLLACPPRICGGDMDVNFEAAVDPLMAVAPARAPSTPADGAPSFDDHVAAQTAEPDRADAQPKQAEDTPVQDAVATPAAAVAPQATQMAPTLTVQLVASADPAFTPSDAAPPTAGTPVDISAPAPAAPAAPAPVEASAGQQPVTQSAPQHAVQPHDTQQAPTHQAQTQTTAPADTPASTPDAPKANAQQGDVPAPADVTQTAAAQPQPAQQTTAASPELAAQLAALATTPVPMTAPQAKDSAPAPQTKAIDGAKPAGEKTAPADALDFAAPQPKAEAPPAPPAANAQARVESAAAKPSETAPVQQAAPQQSAPPPAQVEQRHAIAEATPPDAARTAPVSHQVTREIVRKFNGGTTQFELRLDPAELGRVDVRLEVGRDNKVTAVVAAETPQALSELARGARDIAQALQSAGLELSENGLSFDLSQRQSQYEAAADARSSGARGASTEEEAAPAPIVAARPFGLESWRGVRVDLVA